MHALAQPDGAPTPGLLVSDPNRAAQAAALQLRYGLARLTAPPRCGFYLELADSGLQLRQVGPGAAGPIRIDFLAGALAHRLRYGGGRRQPLARAVGMKPGFSPAVWDATAGLGRDALVLASLGSRVTLCERSPVLAALLEDALQRASRDAQAGAWVGAHMQLRFADAAAALAALSPDERPEVVYLDPMYPPGKASVLVKKDMRALQLLLGDDRDSAGLLEAALAAARRRVVVKRPRRAGWLAQKRPSASIESRNTRYDLYVTLSP